MSMTDPISDMLTRIRNGVMAHHTEVKMPTSRIKLKIAEILRAEGYIHECTPVEEAGRQLLQIKLKWVDDQPAIEGLQRVSRPGQRQYARGDQIPKVRNGLGIMIVSTSRGVMTDRAARRAGIGGELICSVW